MKKHISITIDEHAYAIARRIAVEEERSVSQVFERSILQASQTKESVGREILPSTETHYVGEFVRADAYAGRT